MPVHLGIIGCGRIVQRVHLRHLTSIGGVEIAAFADPSDDARAAVAKRLPDATGYADPSKLLKHSGLDAVVIATPPAGHAPLAEAALRAGLAVYVEKPLATTRAEAEGLLAVEAQTRGTLNVGFNYRFNPQVVDARRRIKAGDLGRVLSIQSSFTTAPRDTPDWKKNRAAGGGVLLDLAVHHLDLVSFLVGRPITRVAATVNDRHSEQDTATLTLTTADGVTGQVFVATSAAETDRMVIVGESGTLELDRFYQRDARLVGPTVKRDRASQVKASLGELLGSPSRAVQKLRGAGDVSHRASLAAFVRAVAEKRPMPVPSHVGLHAAAVLEAAERSATSGKTETVQLPDHLNNAPSDDALSNDAPSRAATRPRESAENKSVAEPERDPLGRVAARLGDDDSVNTAPEVSVVIPAYNAAPYLDRCLAGLASQVAAPPFEVLLVDNNSSDDTLAIAERHAAEYPWLRVLRQPKQGAYAARNRGMSVARGGTLVFTDPDCVPRPDWLARLTERLAEPGVQIVMGRDKPTGTGRGIELLAAYDHAKEAYTLALDNPTYYYGHTNNLATTRAAWEAHGPFVEVARGADVIFVHRVLERHGTDAVVYAPDAVVDHLEIDSPAVFFTKCRAYGRSSVAYNRYVSARPLTMRQRWAVFRKARRDERLGPADSARLLAMLVKGVVIYINAQRTARAEQRAEAVAPVGQASSLPLPQRAE